MTTTIPTPTERAIIGQQLREAETRLRTLELVKRLEEAGFDEKRTLADIHFGPRHRTQVPRGAILDVKIDEARGVYDFFKRIEAEHDAALDAHYGADEDDDIVHIDGDDDE